MITIPCISWSHGFRVAGDVWLSSFTFWSGRTSDALSIRICCWILFMAFVPTCPTTVTGRMLFIAGSSLVYVVAFDPSHTWLPPLHGYRNCNFLQSVLSRYVFHYWCILLPCHFYVRILFFARLCYHLVACRLACNRINSI